MGVVTDRAKTRFGRFVPFLVLGALLLPPSVFAIFHPPEFEAQLAAFAYLLFTYICVNTAMTIIGVPHLALGGALTPDTNERTEVYGWKLVFGTLGLFFGILAPLMAVGAFGLDVSDTDGLRDSRGWAATGIGVVILLTTAVTVWSVWRPSRIAEDAVLFTWKAVREGSKAVFSQPDLPSHLPRLCSCIHCAGHECLAGIALLSLHPRALGGGCAEVDFGDLFSLHRFSRWQSGFLSDNDLARSGQPFPVCSRWGLMTMVLYPLFPAGQLLGPVVRR